MKIFQVAEDEKCGCCNWQASRLYFAAEDQKSADELYKYNGNDRGLCASCLIDLFREEGYEIIAPSNAFVVTQG